jgi:hypothetical protein
MTDAPTPMAAPTLVLISGFARAGKDTLASGLLEWSTRPAEHINLADSLKEASNHFLDYLGLDGSFFNEQFKCDNRDALVNFGKFARRMDPDVFARHFANWVPVMKHHDQPSPETVVTSDWRYINELRVAQDILWEKGWKVRTIYVATAGVGPANDEELDSIAEIRAAHLFDQEYIFKPNSRNQIMSEGRLLAKSWKL